MTDFETHPAGTADLVKMQQNLEHWRQEVGKLHSRVSTLTDQLTRANAATAAAYEVAARAIMKKCHDDMDRKEEAAIVRALASADQTAALDRLIAEAVGSYVEALAWYGEQARLARLIHSEGDAGRNALQADGGKRANAILAASKKGGV